MAMTVGALIDVLHHFDPEAEVFVGVGYDGGTAYLPLEEIDELGAHLIEKTPWGDFHEPSEDPDLEQAVFLRP